MSRPIAPAAVLEERFWSRVDRDPVGCWEWQGYTNGRYGLFPVGRRNVYAHRFVAERYLAGWDAALQALHHCDNPRCVRPSHLFIGTHGDNMRDAKAKGRTRNGPFPSGTAHPRAKLDETKVRCIRERYTLGEGLTSLGRSFGVTPQAIDAVVKRAVWKGTD